jgi:hypothetical protein
MVIATSKSMEISFLILKVFQLYDILEMSVKLGLGEIFEY